MKHFLVSYNGDIHYTQAEDEADAIKKTVGPDKVVRIAEVNCHVRYMSKRIYKETCEKIKTEKDYSRMTTKERRYSQAAALAGILLAQSLRR